jgi:hypothetical protein
MFKRGVKPRWEDPRNIHGGTLSPILPPPSNVIGAWTFRLAPNQKTVDFFLHLVLLMIGESLTDSLTPGTPRECVADLFL